jgi:4-amino-4-deoxy-L-arabinose transferase-like glycosyltransferase
MSRATRRWRARCSSAEVDGWITPVLGGHAWLEKPPLYYWQAMLAYSVLGVSDVAARVPAAIDATLLVIAVYLFFRRFRRGVEVDAALITASCAGVIGYAHAASMDMALAATFAIAMLAWWAWRESGKKIYLALFYACRWRWARWPRGRWRRFWQRSSLCSSRWPPANFA